MDRKKHIYLIYEFLSEQGGLEREIINHANFLIEEGFEVKVLTCYLDRKILGLLPFGKLKIETIGKINTGIESLNLILCFLGFNNLKRHNPDSFLSYSFPSNFLIRKKKTKKINYINHYPHFIYLSEKGKKEWSDSTQGTKRKISVFLSNFFKKKIKKTDKKLIKANNLNYTNSQFTKRKLDALYNMDSIVSYPPLDPKFKPSKRKMDEKFIFSSSRIIPDKKYEWLICSLSFMKNRMPLYIAGSVEEGYKNSLKNLANNEKINLKFLGRLTTEDIIEYYSNAQVFAFPTPKEDFGLVPAESLACGTPVVVWGDGSGPTEQVINGVNGYHAKPYNLKDFAKKIDLVIDNKLKQKNRKKIIESAKKFSYNSTKKNFICEIKKLFNNQPK